METNVAFMSLKQLTDFCTADASYRQIRQKDPALIQMTQGVLAVWL